MSQNLHTLSDEMPKYAQQIQSLEQTNTHFARLAGDYDVINREIQRAENGLEAVDDFALEDMKKLRLKLLDEIRHILIETA